MRAYVLLAEAVATLPPVSEAFGVATASQPGTPRLSIVVLPFVNLSNDPEREFFADGITEDLTTELSRIAGMVVISRNTAFTFKGKAVDAKQVGRELGVRYVLEGSVRKFGPQVRITAQLIEAETAAHLWAERFDCEAVDLFSVQDEITSRIAIALNLELIDAEAARPTDRPGALDYLFRGRAAYANAHSRSNFAQTCDWLERALALDPSSSTIKSHLAATLAGRVIDQMTDEPANDIRRAEELVEQALTVSPRDPVPHYARGQVLRAQGRWNEAIREYETVLAVNRNWVFVIATLGWCKFWTGSIDEMITTQEQAIHLSPRDPRLGNYYFRIGLGHLLESRNDEAIVWLEKARGVSPARPNMRASLAAAYALGGDTKCAAAELTEARRLIGDDRFSSITRLKEVGFFGPTMPGYFGASAIRARFEATYFEGLRRAGVPEG